MLQILDCQSFKDCKEKEVLENARNYYNENYEPFIQNEDISNLAGLYKKTVGHEKEGDGLIFKTNNLSAVFVNGCKRFLVFQENTSIEVIEEIKVVGNPFFDVPQD